ncbi:MAG: hypothetical protein ABFS45_04970 [Pseudomonadota bacterium]
MADLQQAHGSTWIKDEVVTIKTTEHKVICKKQELGDYDYLVIALGAGKMKYTGIEHTFSICGKPEGSLEMRDKIDALISKGSGKIAMGFGSNPKC